MGPEYAQGTDDQIDHDVAQKVWRLPSFSLALIERSRHVIGSVLYLITKRLYAMYVVLYLRHFPAPVPFVVYHAIGFRDASGRRAFMSDLPEPESNRTSSRSRRVGLFWG
jgi:hypothetical protein